MRRLCSLALVLSGCNGWDHLPIEVQAKQAALTIEVRGQDGEPVAGVRVRVDSLELPTDQRGLVHFPALTEAGYLVEVSGEGIMPELAGVRLVAGTMETTTRSVVVRASDPSDLRLLFVGDLSFDDGIDDPNRDGIADDSVVPAGRGADVGVRTLLAAVEPVFRRFDLVTGNLATALGAGTTPHPRKPSRALAPPEVARGLTDSGLAVLNLGNDHAYDYLDSGVRETIGALDSVELGHFGAGRDIGEASTPSLVNRQGVVIAQVAQSLVLGHGDIPKHDTPPFFEAEVAKAGVVAASPAGLSAACSEAALSSDVVFAHATAGSEWIGDPAALGPLLEGAAAGGASLLIGHGPRTLQPVLRSASVIGIAGLGGLVFGGQRPEGRLGVMLEADLRFRRLSSLRLWPIALVHYAPELATDRLANRILRRVGSLSRPDVLVYPLGGKGEIVPGNNEVRSVELAKRSRISLHQRPDGSSVSEVVELLGDDLERFVATIDAAVERGPAQALSVELGRELLWDGGFEDQTISALPRIGVAAGWRFRAPDVGASDRSVHSGRLALELVRKSANLGPATLRSGGLYALGAGRSYSFRGCTKSEGAAAGRLLLAVYPSRAVGATSIAELAVVEPMPSEDWRCFSVDLKPEVETLVSPQAELAPPSQGTAHLWIDDLSLVEWRSLPAATQVPFPNEDEYGRVLGSADATEVSLHWVSVRLLPM